MEVLYNGPFQAQRVIDVSLDESGNSSEAREARSAPAALTGNDFEYARLPLYGANQDWLNDTNTLYGFGQGLQWFIFETLAGLKLIRANRTQGDFLKGTHNRRCRFSNFRGLALGDKGAEAPSKSCLSSH
ncbi:unannotated protein [freshwater metagenome]|uniref:Unannotated protein n=1 Tax=freshwater metagenome TaxID=449393 RepID=A0A6J6WMG2_9ZZZZ